MNVVLIAHYFPPINSSGAKRAEALSKYFVSFGHTVSVITPQKNTSHGEFTESVPPGVNLIELNWLGLRRASIDNGGRFEPMYSGRPSLARRVKDWVMDLLGQIPDPRLPFSFSFLSPWFSNEAKSAIKAADIVIGTTPPWPMVLAALICKFRFGKPCVLDYRDHFSECHEMPGGRFAKALEKVIDRRLVQSANHIVCISEPMSKYYRTLSPNVSTILNGYDHELIEQARTLEREPKDSNTLVVRYMGIVSPGRVPHNILRALVRLKASHPLLFDNFRFEFFGNAAVLQNELQLKYPDIVNAFHFFEPVPYLESLQKIVEADYLLFSETSSKNTLSAQGILTTKLFEYLGSGRPILGDISPDTLAGSLALECSRRHIISDDSEQFYKNFSDASFYARQEDYVSPRTFSLSRMAQAKQYSDLAQQVIHS
ncbi:glycosyltransferase [Ideonella sp.]|jgi:hypothetical protein|uniref:glycosyltransferase n=1 Tax=Ideonella sp. TaxID=1929293 RepID=UPI0037BF9043